MSATPLHGSGPGTDNNPLSTVLTTGSPLREQLLVLADIRDSTLSAEILAAITAHIEVATKDPLLRARALDMCNRIAFEAERRIERTARTFGLSDYPSVALGDDNPAA